MTLYINAGDKKINIEKEILMSSKTDKTII